MKPKKAMARKVTGTAPIASRTTLITISAAMNSMGRNGLGAENLAWSIMFLFMPLACVYYPVTTLPVWLQPAAWALPPTYVFEGMRALLIDHSFRADLMLEAFALNAVFLAVGIFGFLKLLQAARRHGSLMQTGE